MSENTRPSSAEIDALREHVIQGMTVPPGGPDDPFWRGAQWAYGQVREALNTYVTTPDRGQPR